MSMRGPQLVNSTTGPFTIAKVPRAPNRSFSNRLNYFDKMVQRMDDWINFKSIIMQKEELEEKITMLEQLTQCFVVKMTFVETEIPEFLKPFYSNTGKQ